MIITEVRDKVRLRWRGKKNERIEETIEDYGHYFYISANDFHKTKERYSYTHFGSRKSIRPTYDVTKEYSINREELIKVSLDSNMETYWLKDIFHSEQIKTYEADISLARKYCVDRLDNIQEYNLRKWYVDIETSVGGTHNKRINAITVYDNFNKIYTVYTWFPESHSDADMKSDWLKDNIELVICSSERDLLIRFLTDLETQDPDMIIGWYILGFDIPTIIKNMCAQGINARRLSPYNEVRGVYTDLSKCLEWIIIILLNQLRVELVIV